ncbi:MAG: hypothetical protein M1830_001556 [Pleopsidium flavum]|nr:MAG: hypothetical protein M1830_001556 [Pleopsidium flavum]
MAFDGHSPGCHNSSNTSQDPSSYMALYPSDKKRGRPYLQSSAQSEEFLSALSNDIYLLSPAESMAAVYDRKLVAQITEPDTDFPMEETGGMRQLNIDDRTPPGSEDGFKRLRADSLNNSVAVPLDDDSKSQNEREKFSGQDIHNEERTIFSIFGKAYLKFEDTKDNGADHGALKSKEVFICECCPKKPRKFENVKALRVHERGKQNNLIRIRSKNEAEAQWSCAALSGVEAAFHPSTHRHDQWDICEYCGYCGEEFSHPANWTLRVEHLTNVHKFGECNQAKKFFRADHFRQHLKHSHAAISGTWMNQLEVECMKHEPALMGMDRTSKGLGPTTGPEKITLSHEEGVRSNQPQVLITTEQEAFALPPPRFLSLREMTTETERPNSSVPHIPKNIDSDLFTFDKVAAPPESPADGYESPPNEVRRQHEAAKEGYMKPSAVEILQEQYDVLLSAFSRSVDVCASLKKKLQLSDSKLNNLTADNIRLQSRVEDLQPLVEALVKSRDEAREQSVVNGRRYMMTMELVSQLEDQGAAIKWKREESEEEAEGLRRRRGLRVTQFEEGKKLQVSDRGINSLIEDRDNARSQLLITTESSKPTLKHKARDLASERPIRERKYGGRLSLSRISLPASCEAVDEEAQPLLMVDDPHEDPQDRGRKLISPKRLSDWGIHLLSHKLEWSASPNPTIEPSTLARGTAQIQTPEVFPPVHWDSAPTNLVSSYNAILLQSFYSSLMLRFSELETYYKAVSSVISRSVLCWGLSEPTLHPGLTRARWTCRCGARLHDDYVELRAGATAELATALDHTQRQHHNQNGFRRDDSSRSVRNLGGSFVSFLNGWLREGSKRDQASALPRHKQQNQPQTPVYPVQQSPDICYLLVCVKHGNYTTRLLSTFVLSARTRTSSEDSKRNITRYWFELHRRSLVDIRKRNDLPPDSEKTYKFTPRPAVLIPPIGRNHLVHIFQHPQDAEDETICLDRFPKRLLQQIAVCSTGDPTTGIGWGLELTEGLHWAKTSCVGLVILVSSMVLGVLWSVFRGDVQGGFGIAAYMVAFWMCTVGTVQAGLEFV